jgi:hypothetical protein
MPQRSNLFQEVVATIHAHMAEPATVEESAMLTNRSTGKTREVDVVIRAEAAGHPIIVSVEASSTTRPASVQWVESMVGKHKNLETSKLVLVSERGFTPQARQLAEAEGVIALAPEDLGEDDPAGVIVNRLRSIWPKVVSLTATGAQICVPSLRPEDPWFEVKPDLNLFLGDNRRFLLLGDVIREYTRGNLERIIERMGLQDIAEDFEGSMTLEVEAPWEVLVDGEHVPVFVRWHPPGSDAQWEFHRVEILRIDATATVRVTEVALRHRRLGDVAFAFGEGLFGERAALLVATENEVGVGKLTVRFREDSPRP